MIQVTRNGKTFLRNMSAQQQKAMERRRKRNTAKS